MTAIACCQCGKEETSKYIESVQSEMDQRQMCWHCNYWKNFELKNKPALSTVIDGRIYSPGNRTSGEFRGMAGRRFDIEYIEPSAYAGQRVTTFDLWAGSEIPEHLKAAYPDTARFLSNAAEVNAGGTACWNPSSGKNPVYPLPSSRVIRKPTPQAATPQEG